MKHSRDEYMMHRQPKYSGRTLYVKAKPVSLWTRLIKWLNNP
jgi:hypothetical protein